MKINYPIIKSLSFLGVKIVVYDGYYLSQETDLKDFENVVCYDENDLILWKIHGAKESGHWLDHDSFTNVGVHENDDCVATSFSGHVFNVDIKTGEASYKRFVK